MRYWYAVQTKPRQEAVAELHLQRQHFETYLPKILVRKHRRDKWTKVVEPLFPRYLFVRLDPDENSLSPVRSTKGVAGPVRFGRTAAAVQYRCWKAPLKVLPACSFRYKIPII